MSKKKKGNLKKQLHFELLGLLFIFLAIFGSGAGAISDGFIPSGLENILRFFLGIWYFVASIALLLIGVLLLVKRRYPVFTDKKLIGFYIAFLGLLLITHIQTFERILLTESGSSIIKLTWNGFIAYVNGTGSVIQTGGGIIGGVMFAFTYYLFSSIGAKIVGAFSIVIGFIFMTDFSVGNFMSKMWKKIKHSYQTFKMNRTESKRQKRLVDETEVEVTEIKEIEEVAEEELQTDAEADVIYSHNKKQEEDKEVTAAKENDTSIKVSDVAEIENVDYRLPPIDLLADPAPNTQQQDKSQIQKTIQVLEKTFHSFGVKAKVTKVNIGPAVTKYEIYPEAGVKVSRIVSLHDDLALALAAQDIRIEAPIPGKSAVGIEVPNQDVAMVSLREVLDAKTKEDSKLLFALGRDISGDAVVGELNKMPHLLIAGATGSGKSVCINGIITSILMRAKPHEVKMMMIDPKKVELSVYNGIPHLLTPVVTDAKKASQALRKVVAEMEKRYELFSKSATRNIESYNEHVKKFNQSSDEGESELPYLPYIVVLVDELADLMMEAAKDVEDSITRLAQMARAAGIHLIIATQRPSVDVITGVIKANIPSRIAFSVSSQVDSRTILDVGGAEKLLGRGDMLYIPVGNSKPTRVQGAFLSDEEVERIVSHCMEQQEVTYQEDMIPEEIKETDTDVDDELYEEAVQFVIERQTASASMLQRKFKVGYNRAARLIDAMEERGIIGPFNASKPRNVLVTETDEDAETN